MSLNTILQYDFTSASFTNNKLNDLGPNGLHATLVNGPLLNQPGASISLKSASFDGSTFNYIGCYNDSNNPRAIPTNSGNVGSVEQCKNNALSKNQTLFGLQYYGQCWIGNDYGSATRYGTTSYSCSGLPLGGAWNNQLYSVKRQYISVPSFTTPNNGITFSFWFRSVNSATWGRIFDFGNGSSSDNIIAYINNGNLGLCVYKNTNGDRKQYDNVLGYNVNSGNWMYIAWVLNINNSWTLYVNGSIVSNPGSNPGAGYYPISKARNNNYLGKSNWNDPYFNGNICDFRMFDGILTQDNITNIYNTNTTPSNLWKYTPSISNFIKIFQNNYVTNWSNLNVDNSLIMSISFFIKLTNLNPNWRNIFHITNTNNNCCNSGDRLPGVWITPNDTGLHLAFCDVSNTNIGFVTNSKIKLNTSTKIDIIINLKTVYVYFNNILVTIYTIPNNIVQANDNAYFYLADPWHPSVDMYISDFTIYNGISINPPTSTDNYEYIGCYNDTDSRAIPNYVANVSKQEYCKEFAISNKATLYGVQYNGQCFVGNNINDALKYGPATDCPPLGGAWNNQIYSINKPSYSFFSSYGITDSSNMTFRFTINIQNTNSNIRSIVQVSNTNNKSGSSGDIVPGVFITKSALSLTIINDINTAPNSSFTTNILPAKTDINVVIVWNGKKVYVYFNNNLVNINTFSQPLIPAIPNAFVYIGQNNWYPTSVDYTIKDIKFSNGALIKPPTSTNVYSNIGCYNDNSSKRAIPNYIGKVSSVNDCQEFAISQNSPLFGVQNSSENGADCYLGNNINDALQYSEANNCPTMGGPLTNQIYSTQGIPEETFEYAKCYKDVNTDALPDKLGNVRNIYDCEVLAKNKAYITYGLQNNGICYGGNNIDDARKYGLQTDSSKCTKLGGEKTNQLYNITQPPSMSNMSANMPSSVNKYTYQGCYNNIDNTSIPTIIKKKVASVAECSDIAYSKQFNTFGVSNGDCYGSNNLAEGKIQGENNASYYCGTLGSDSTYQIYFRDEKLDPFPPESPGDLSLLNFADSFSNYNTDNNTKFKLFKLLIMIIFIIILIYLIYCI